MATIGHGEQPEWAQPDWFEKASAWVVNVLARHQIEVCGRIEQPHLRPWSTVLRIPTSDGFFYFKAMTPTFGHEPAVTQALHQWRPDCTPEVLATNVERGWVLMRSSGVALRTLLHGPQDLHHWERVLPLYAELQIELTQRCDDLLALGAPDRRLDSLPGLFEDLFFDHSTLRVGLVDGLSGDEERRLRARAPDIAAWSERLAASGIPESLHHDDFHDGNIFYQEGRYILADWAECAVAHPFFALVLAPRAIAYRAGLPESAPIIVRLIDCYLEPWRRYASRATLLEAVALARPLGALCRALTWHRVVSAMIGLEREEYNDDVPRWLREVLQLGDQ